MRFRFRFLSVAVVVGLSCAIWPVLGSTPEETDGARPVVAETAKMITEDAFTVPRGKTEVELLYGVGVVRDEFDADGDLVDRPDFRGHVLTLSVTHGFLERLDARFSILGLKLSHDESDELVKEEGIAAANLKWRFFESEDSEVAFSLLAGLSAPIGSPSRRQGLLTVLPSFWSIDNLLAFTLVKNRFNLSSNIGLFTPIGSARDEYSVAAVGDVAVGYQVLRWLQPQLEINYAYDFIQGPANNSSILGLTLGAIINVNDFMRLDLGVAHGVIGQRTEELATASVNLSLSF